MTKSSDNQETKLDVNQVIDRLCDQFEEQWQAGSDPRIERYLENLASENHSQVLWELLALELELRQQQGEIPERSEYANRFQNFTKVVHDVFREQETAVANSMHSLTQSPEVVDNQPKDFAGTERFKILKKLGQGGFGQVYAVHDRFYLEDCALKLLTLPEGGSLYRFKREFRTLASLNHPNLIKLKELIADEDYWFFTMELIKGVPLNQALPKIKTNSFEPELSERIPLLFGQLLDGLEAMHENGFVHRDLKPGNVMVTPENRVVVLDLGLVSTIQSEFPEWQQSVELGVAGTISYMAPEQAREQFSPASDCYAIGVMLFETLTGMRPFQGSPLAILQAKQTFAAPEPREYIDGIPENLNRLCCDLLERIPEDRPTISEIRERLAITPVSHVKPTASPQSRHELIGREAEIETLHRAALRLSENVPALVYVDGLSGVGKTSLVDEFLHQYSASKADVIVLNSRCYERESVPYKAFDGIIDSLSRHLNKMKTEEASLLLPRHIGDLARLFPVLQRVQIVADEVKRYRPPSDFQESRRRAIQSLKELLSAMADRQNVVLTIDDLQWGDRDSARLLQELFYTEDAPAVLLIATYRSNERERSSCLRQLLDSETRSEQSTELITEIALSELTEEDARQLARSLLSEHQQNDETINQIAAEAGGSPYFIRELIRHTESLGGQFTTLDEVIVKRVHKLNEDLRRVLEFIAISGQPLTILEILEIANVTRAELDQLRNENLIRTSGTSQDDFVECYHDRIRESVTADVTFERRQQIHQVLVNVLENIGRADSQTLGQHFESAGMSVEAISHYEKAAEDALQQLAFNQAAHLYERILTLSEVTDQEIQAHYHSLIGEAYASDGQGERAAQHYELAADASVEEERAFELYRLAMMRLFQVGRLSKAHQLLENLLKDVKLAYPHSMMQVVRGIVWERILRTKPIRPLASRLHRRSTKLAEQRIKTCWAAAQSLSILDPVRGCYFQHIGERETNLAPHLMESSLLIAYGACLIAATGHQKDIRAARRILEDLRASPNYPGTCYTDAFVEMCEGATDYLTSDFSRAIERCTQASEGFTNHCPEAWWEADLSRMFALFSANFSGNINRIRELTTIDAATRSKRDTTYHDLMIRGVSEIVLDMARDDFSQTQSRTKELATLLDFNEFNNLHFNYYLRHLWELRYRDENETCWETMVKIEKPFRSALLQGHHWSRHAYSLHRASAAIATIANHQQDSNFAEVKKKGLIADAEKHISKLRKESIRSCSAEADLLMAGLSVTIGRDDAMTYLPKALAGFRSEKLVMYEAICYDRLARLGNTQASQIGSEAAKKYVSEHGIVASDKFFQVFSPGNWPAK
ncbi:protein kinase [uncultured Rubinisphaera sp.]|uniref:protein kinase domain-containing protein n=1 Tax=uncultured Rubinisphaera sp. TaxID=1678686 RepID=UPI0030DA8783